MPSHAIPLLPGYELVERLGRGAGATISLAIERATRRQVAIKHVVRHTAADERFIAQAETEYEVSHRLKHPNLRRCYDIVRLRKWLRTQELFLIMEYIDGVRLEEAVPTRIDEIVRIFECVAEGLHALHQAGFAHADIKPNNIMLARDGGVKIIDFGQSCPLGHTKQRIQGTRDFMAPEQIFRKAIDQRTDVFNLGASLYFVLTGKWFKTLMPNAPTASKKIEIESKRGNLPPHELNAQIPVPLSRLVMDCCETRPADRPRDMREVISRLQLVRHLLERREGGEGRRRRAARHPRL